MIPDSMVFCPEGEAEQHLKSALWRMHHRMPVENGASRTQILLQEHPVREPNATPTCSEHLVLLLLGHVLDIGLGLS